ncbi:MAG: molybdopterin-dependent oxidoreductase, partial [Aquificaceae bacterium]|nr:molybdopterin-dependent oxidoreductase [Aquificaceae bacterium]
DELNFPWERVLASCAPASNVYFDPKMGLQLTGGSTSLRNMFEPMRRLGASLKDLIARAASIDLSLPLESLILKDGKVFYKNQNAPYGRFIKTALTLKPTQEPKLKKESEFIYIGKSPPRLDIPPKVKAEATFGIDARIENHLYAIVERPPRFGSRALEFNRSYILSLPEVQDAFILSNGAIGIIANSFWACERARKGLKVLWSETSLKGMDTDRLYQLFLRQMEKPPSKSFSTGLPQSYLKRASVKVEETFFQPYLYHATLEPMTCLAYYDGKRCIVIAPTQSQSFAFDVTKSITSLPDKSIQIQTPYLGGGFGRKSHAGFIAEAVELSKRVKKPVKLIYSREDDVRSGFYRPMSVTKVLLAGDSFPRLLSFKIVAQPLMGGGASTSGLDDYHFENTLIERYDIELEIPVWFWRSVGHTHNAFSLEHALDIYAYKTSQDPIKLRMALLKDKRAKSLIEFAKERWGDFKGAGLAYHSSFGSRVVAIAKAKLNEGSLAIERMLIAIDIGNRVIHPDLVRQQIEGSVVMGLSLALKEELLIKDGAAASLNFDSYKLLTIDEVPPLETYILTSNSPMGGVGEPVVPVIAPAVANSLLWSYGIKTSKLPIKVA